MIYQWRRRIQALMLDILSLFTECATLPTKQSSI
jgi:hypothetical protein